jgi:pyruvate ferredoxin oxidoreductase alpha subunit
MLYVAASDRLPIVLAAVNRALTGPININADHSDSMGARDTGWIQLYSENAQEAYDNLLMANRIGERADVMLPVMVCQDGFITSHGIENIIVEDDDKAKAFVGDYRPDKYLLNPEESLAVGPYSVSPYVIEMKRAVSEAMANAKEAVSAVSGEFGKVFGRAYGFFEEYRVEDAEYAVLLMSSAAGTGKDAVDALRDRGVKAGLVKLRMFRPFPARELADALKRLKALAIMDRSDGFSATGGPLNAEVRAALYGKSDVKTAGYVYGLGGRDVRVEDFFTIFDELAALASGAEQPYCRYIGVRE